MQITEQPRFFAILSELCGALDKPPMRDETKNAYWKALHDARLSEVQFNVERIIRTATSTTKFPRPNELRNTPVETEKESDGKFEHAMRGNQIMWDEWMRSDEELAHLEKAIAHVARTLVLEPHATVLHDEALNEDRKLRDMRVKLWRERAIASGKLKPKTRDEHV